MARKPSYDDLVRRVQDLEAEVERLSGTSEALKARDTQHREVEELALLGYWELDLTTNKLFWSDEIYRIFDLDPQEFGATYEAFLETVHPDDRAFVDRTYTGSLENKTGYDITHRLLLRDGSIRYVREKCKTDYDEHGQPLRSLGTVQDITEQMLVEHGYSGIIGREPVMRELFETIEHLAGVAVPVLIQGESGTGKELVATAIHNEGPRASGPFVPVNCGALPEGLLESELFGHVKGAFTGAAGDKKGRFELAHGGTLFFDEIVDLPMPLQPKLLRVLQDGQFVRLGDERTRSVDVRIISAANRDLGEEVKAGNFREDLFYRLKVVPVHVPPLRDRRGDIPFLVEHFLQQAALHGQMNQGVSREALAVLIDHPWNGNVRELQSAVQYSLVKSRGRLIEVDHLSEDIRKDASIPAGPSPYQEIRQRSVHASSEDAPRTRGRKKKLDARSVERALEQSGGNKVEAARILGVGRATLYRHLKRGER